MSKEWTKSSRTTKNLVGFSMITAIMLIFGFVPQLGFLTVGTFAIAIILIPVGIFTMLGNKWIALYVWIMFGLTAFITANFIIPDPIFNKWYMSLAPRMMIGFIYFYFYWIIEFLKKGGKTNMFLDNYFVAGAFGQFLNSFIIIVFLVNFFNVNVSIFFAATALPNILIEWILFTSILLSTSFAIRRFRKWY